MLWLVAAIAIVTAHFRELLLFLLIILIHELGHSVAAAYFSWRINRISLLPFGGVAEMDEHGNRSLKEEAIVILAGPLQHVWLIGGSYLLFTMGLISAHTYDTFFVYNLMVLIFNLLPIWPLDGGKFVFLLCSLKFSFPKAFKWSLAISTVTVVFFSLFMLVTGAFNLNVWIVLSFLIFSLYHEWKQSRYVFIRFLLERYYGKNNGIRKLKPIIVKDNELVIHVLEQFQRGYKHPIIIEKNGKEKGVLDENELLHAYFTEKRVTATVGSLLYLY